MRILGYIDHPVLKITVFKMDTRISVKFEDRTVEQTYRFQISDQLNSLHEVRALVEQQLLPSVVPALQQMQRWQQQALLSLRPAADEDEFEDII